MQIIINSSPLIFLSKLNYLNQFFESSDDFYIPQSVADEIKAKSDPSSQTVQALINSGNLQVRASKLITIRST
ncbi:PIN domain-containing protein [Fortiea sp. LEGE XX443]|uniref:PIN domain-containing protein n=1 Tax=Fortiea sp. LEGE XX443 TaxID=1828611 RepID=UPI001D13AF8A|nr:PIN domain-containing protein [Fortiea sp. LEGE XX443]